MKGFMPFCIVIGAFCLATNSRGQIKMTTQKEVMTCGYNIVPPFSIKIDNEATGFVIEYFKKIAWDMGVELKLVSMPLARLHKSLEESSKDCVVFIGRGEGSEKIDADVDLLTFKMGLIVPKKSKIDSTTLKDSSRGFKLATKLKMFIPPTLKNPHIAIKYFGGSRALQTAIKNMMAGRFDAVYSPAVSELKYMAAEQGIFDKVKFILLPEAPRRIVTSFSKTGAEKFKLRYESILHKISVERPIQTLGDDFLKKSVEKNSQIHQ